MFGKIHLKCERGLGGGVLEVDDPRFWMPQLKKQLTKSDYYSGRGEGGHRGGKKEKIKEEGRGVDWH